MRAFSPAKRETKEWKGIEGRNPLFVNILMDIGYMYMGKKRPNRSLCRAFFFLLICQLRVHILESMHIFSNVYFHFFYNLFLWSPFYWAESILLLCGNSSSDVHRVQAMTCRECISKLIG